MAAVLYSKHDNTLFLYKVTNSPSLKTRHFEVSMLVFSLFQIRALQLRHASSVRCRMVCPIIWIFILSPPFSASICWDSLTGSKLIWFVFPTCAIRFGTDPFLHAMFRLGCATQTPWSNLNRPRRRFQGILSYSQLLHRLHKPRSTRVVLRPHFGKPCCWCSGLLKTYFQLQPVLCVFHPWLQYRKEFRGNSAYP